MGNKIIFLDRDGTINVDYNYVHQKDKLTFTPNAAKGLKKLQDAGYKLVVISNQSGINRGIFTQEQCDEFNKYMLEKLEEAGVHIDKIYTCPHMAEENCECRKPKIKMYMDATEEFDGDLSRSFAIGDRDRDLCICQETEVEGVLVGERDGRDKDADRYPRKKDLLEAAEYILARAK